MKFVELAAKALRSAGVIGQGVPASDYYTAVAFEAANDMIDGWASKRLTIFQTLMRTFPIVANKGGKSNPYTIGLGGDLDMPRPTWISDANQECLTTTPPFEYGLTILKPSEYAAIGIKDLGAGLANCLYFDGKWDTTGADVGLGHLYLYPVPNGQLPLQLVLYVPSPMSGFADEATTDYTFPPGYAEALRYQLAKRLCVEFSRPMSADLSEMCRQTFALIEEANVPIPNIRSDFGIPGTGSASGLYNWRTGTNTPRGGF